MKRLNTVSKVIEAFGGRRPFATVMMTTPQAVDNWRRANAFPANTYFMLRVHSYANELIVPDHLFAMRQSRTKIRRRR